MLNISTLILHTFTITAEEEKSGNGNGNNGKSLDKAVFERYMTQHKPYLNPKLRITDLAVRLCTNRLTSLHLLTASMV